MQDIQKSTSSPRPGRPKSLKKRKAILDAAKRLFLQASFDAVSVDQIATEAGVSKLTVYSHFKDKESLFFAAIEEQCRQQLPDDLFEIPSAIPLEPALREIGGRFHDLLASDDSIALHRMLIADPRNVERLGALFWSASGARIQAGLDSFLKAAVARDELAIDDTRRCPGARGLSGKNVSAGLSSLENSRRWRSQFISVEIAVIVDIQQIESACQSA